MRSEMQPGGILCAIDVNDYDQAVVDLAGAFAKSANTGLNLLHVTKMMPDPRKAAGPAYPGLPYIVIQDHNRFQKITTNVEGVEIERHHLSGFPTMKILEFVERNKPQLLVLGTHGRQGLSRIIGSTATKVMRNVSCPVLVFRQRQNCQSLDDLKPKQSELIGTS